jgi:hypothetical protein
MAIAGRFETTRDILCTGCGERRKIRGFAGMDRRSPDGFPLHHAGLHAGETTDVAADHPEIVARIDAYPEAARSDSPGWPVGVADRSRREGCVPIGRRGTPCH